MSDETSVSKEESDGLTVIYLILILSVMYIATLIHISSVASYVILLIIIDFSIVKQDKRVIPRWIMFATTIVYLAYYYISFISGKTYLLNFYNVINALYLIIYSEYFTRYILNNEEKILLDEEVPAYAFTMLGFVFTFELLLSLLWGSYVNSSDKFSMSVSFLDYLLSPYILSILLSFIILWLYDIYAIKRIMSRVMYNKPASINGTIQNTNLDSYLNFNQSISDDTKLPEEESKGEKVIYLILIFIPLFYISSLTDNLGEIFFVILLIVFDYDFIKEDKHVIPRWIMIATTIVFLTYDLIFRIFGIKYFLYFSSMVYAVYLILYSEYFTRYILKNEENLLVDLKVPMYILIIGVFVFSFGLLLLLMWLINSDPFVNESQIPMPFLDYLQTPYGLSRVLFFAILWFYDFIAMKRLMPRIVYSNSVF